MLCLKHSFLGNGGIKHPEADDLRFTDMFVSFLSVYSWVDSFHQRVESFRFLKIICLFAEITLYKYQFGH